MDSSRVLVALQELEKWRERRVRVEARLRRVQARRRYLEKELEAARREAARFEGIPEAPVEPVSQRLPFAAFSNVR